MRFTIGFDVSSHKFRFNGHRSFYARVLFGSRWVWIQRWDTARAPQNRFLSADGLMGWTWGVAPTKEACQ
jgi:hypothetical protein